MRIEKALRSTVQISMMLAWLSSTGVATASDAQAEVGIKIYTASYCGECMKAKAYMQAKQIDFVEYDVEKNRGFLRDFYAQGGKGVPYLFVKGQAMHGFEVAEFERLRSRAESRQ